MNRCRGAVKVWLEDQETKWDDRHRHNVLHGAGMGDMTAKVQAKVRVGEAARAQEGGNDESNETARQDWRGFRVSPHARPVQGGGPQKRQLQQQPKPKAKLQLKQQPEQQQQHESRAKPTPAPA